jgi:hypothetical protein
MQMRPAIPNGHTTKELREKDRQRVQQDSNQLLSVPYTRSQPLSHHRRCLFYNNIVITFTPPNMAATRTKPEC